MITVVSDVGGDTVTLHAHGAKLELSIADSYQLLHHLQYALDQLIADQVAKERQQFVTARFK